ncbi:MAG: hypothetical protein LUB59_00070 [Candidatus Gastranaerophilales bacterium]|nr:hypothetical protein [Candidatus Gastranaerophilales bacterium]
MAKVKKRFRKNDFHLMLFDEEWLLLEAKAAETHKTKSEFLRDYILYGEVQDGRREIMSNENVQKLIYEINKIGTNINQIAYNSNLKRSTGREEILLLKEQYDELLAFYTRAFFPPDEEEETGDCENGDY